MNLSAAEFDAIKRAAVQEIADRFFESVDVDELNTMELATCASFLGIPVDRAAKVLPYIEVGPRSRRVTIKDYKAYCQANTRNSAKRILPNSSAA
jgi:hypothetical protein